MNAARALLLAVVCAALLAGEAQARAGQAGVVTAWGVDDIPLVEPGTRFKAVAAGGEHNLALKSDGTVVAWGAGRTNNPSDDADFGQSIVPPGLSNVVAVSAGGFHSMATQARRRRRGLGRRHNGAAGPERRHCHRRGRLEQRRSGRRSGADAPGAAAGRPGAAHPERNCRMALHGQRLDRPRELDALDDLRGDQRRYADC